MLDRIIVSNSTPIIALSNINRLDILRELYGTIVIPTAVKDEISVKNPDFHVQHKWIKVQAITNLAAYKAFTSVLHAGEVEVIILAMEIEAELVILDDGLARKHANYLNLNLTGTIGVLLKAKKEKVIEQLRPVLDELLKNGFYLSNEVYTQVLELADE